MDEIYIARGNERLGPFSASEIQMRIAQGHFSVTELAWKQGMPDWVPLTALLPTASIPTMLVPAVAVPTMVASTSGQQGEYRLQPDEVRCDSCGAPVRNTFKQCPFCGHKMRQGCLSGCFAGTVLGIISIVLLGLGLLFFLITLGLHK